MDSCLNSVIDRRVMCWNTGLPNSVKITQCNGHHAVQGHSRSPILVPIESSYAVGTIKSFAEGGFVEFFFGMLVSLFTGSVTWPSHFTKVALCLTNKETTVAARVLLSYSTAFRQPGKPYKTYTRSRLVRQTSITCMHYNI